MGAEVEEFEENYTYRFIPILFQGSHSYSRRLPALCNVLYSYYTVVLYYIAKTIFELYYIAITTAVLFCIAITTFELYYIAITTFSLYYIAIFTFALYYIAISTF